MEDYIKAHYPRPTVKELRAEITSLRTQLAEVQAEVEGLKKELGGKDGAGSPIPPVNCRKQAL